MKITKQLRKQFIALKFQKKVLPDLDMTKKEKDKLKGKRQVERKTMYYKDENEIVYLEDPESPSAVYSAEEWVEEKARLLTGLNAQITELQNQIDNIPTPITIEESYPQDVKDVLQSNNDKIPSTESLQIQITEKQNLIDEINNL